MFHCRTIPFIDITAARILNKLGTRLRRDGVRLILPEAIDQVRDVFTAVTEKRKTAEFHRTVSGAVDEAVDPSGADLGDTTREESDG